MDNNYYRNGNKRTTAQNGISQQGNNGRIAQNPYATNTKRSYYRVPPQSTYNNSYQSNQQNICRQPTRMQNNTQRKNNGSSLKMIIVSLFALLVLILLFSRCKKNPEQPVMGTETESSSQTEIQTEKQTEAVTSLPVKQPTSNIKICIDPGHGYDDPGTGEESSYMNGTYEKDINLAISLKVFNLLSENGYDVIITHEDDVKPENYGNAQYLFGVKKRMEWVAAQGNVGMLVSIHCNSYPADESIHGIRLYYCNSNGKSSEALGKKLCEKIEKYVKPDKTPTLTGYDYDKAFYVTKAINIPAVLIEVGFVTNKEDVANMKDEKWQTKIATAIYDGIINSIS